MRTPVAPYEGVVGRLSRDAFCYGLIIRFFFIPYVPDDRLSPVIRVRFWLAKDVALFHLI
jgi:hypothetical protein